MSSGITPYKVHVSNERIGLLRQKLALTTFPDFEGFGWDLGTPLSEVKRLARVWETDFDWRTAEKTINKLPHFTTDIAVDGFETLNVHFIHAKSPIQGAIPLLFGHGWPGGFWEASKMLPILTSGGGEAVPTFDVVVPSLPGYGFSEGFRGKGFGLLQFTEVLHKLMLKLGYDEYVTQGGDFGAPIRGPGNTRSPHPVHTLTKLMNIRYGGIHVKATHWNGAFVTQPPRFIEHPLLWLQHMSHTYTPSEKAGLAQWERYWNEGSGYYAMQSTKSQTLGYSLADSPVGLLAWILDKLHNWTDNYPWTDDEILTWASLYLFSRAGPAASIRSYYASKNWTLPWVSNQFMAPIGASQFPKELLVSPSLWVKTIDKLAWERTHESIPAVTPRPKELTDDIREFLGNVGPVYGMVQGRAGYPDRSV